jgi:hypothetical protein
MDKKKELEKDFLETLKLSGKSMKTEYIEFYQKLVKRFNKYNIHKISEDCIRYDFFASLISIIDTTDMILEYPHSKSKIDCVVNYPDNLIEALEFKFFRSIPSGENNPQTQLLGQLFKDIYKLYDFEEADTKKIIIVSNKKMINYINNQFKLFENSHENDLEIKISLATLNNQENTFQKNIKPYENKEVKLKRKFYRNITDEYIVVVLEIIV